MFDIRQEIVVAGQRRLCRFWMVAACFLILPWTSRADIVLPDTIVSYCGGKASLGYRVVSTEQSGQRAGEYTLLDSGPTVASSVAAYRNHHHVYFDLDYLGDRDYGTRLALDYRGLLRIDLNGMAMVHNLDHFPYDEVHRPDAIDPEISSVFIEDRNPRDGYHYEVEEQSVRFRGKLPGIPAHLKLSYWRHEREGEKQLRFLDESCNGCHMTSRSQSIDRITEEAVFALDGHLAAIDLEVEHLIRTFDARERIPVDRFDEHNMRPGPADLQHDETPDSRLMTSTVKAHTSLSGGLVGAASFTYGKRENRSDLEDVRPVDADVTFRKSAGDLTYVPSSRWSLNLRYRLLDLDEDTSDAVTVADLAYQGADRGAIAVRPGIDLTRAYYQGVLTYRPLSSVTVKGEYRREEIDRDPTGGPEAANPFVTPIVIDDVWELPEEEIINAYRVSLFGHWGKGRSTTLKGYYEYRDSSDPAYGSSNDRQHQAFGALTWRPTDIWGGSASVRYTSGSNDEFRIFKGDGSGGFRSFSLDRDAEDWNLTLGLWAQPRENLRLGLHYSFLQRRIDQDVLFGYDATADWFVEDESLHYRQQVQNLSWTGSWRIHENLEALAELGYILSKAYYDPSFATRSLAFINYDNEAVFRQIDDDDLRELTELDLEQWSLKAGFNWKITPLWSCSGRYTLDDYEDRADSIFDGRVETVSIALARSW